MKLCRKFGYETISELIPEKDRKLIVHMKKEKKKEEKKKEILQQEISNKTFDQFMDDDDAEQTAERNPAKKGRKTVAYAMDGLPRKPSNLMLTCPALV